MSDSVRSGSCIEAAPVPRPDKEPRATIRALHVIPGPAEGSSMIFARRESSCLRYADIEIRQFFLQSRTSLIRMMREFFRLRRQIRDFRPHVIHAHYGTVTAMFCGLATMRPLVVTFRGSDLNPGAGNLLRWRIGHLFSQLGVLRASRTICVTRQLKDRLWWRRKHATIIPGCIDLRSFCPRPRNEARAILGWPVTEKVVLFNVGKHPRIKRQDLAEVAVRKASKVDPSIKMTILDGEIDPETIPLYLNAADCLLITSDWEGSPYIVKEALSCNLPIVSVDVGDVSERIEGVTPSRIVHRDPEALGTAIVEVMSLGSRSNGHLAMRDLSEENVAERVRSIYERIISSDQLVGSERSSAFRTNPA